MALTSPPLRYDPVYRSELRSADDFSLSRNLHFPKPQYPKPFSPTTSSPASPAPSSPSSPPSSPSPFSTRASRSHSHAAPMLTSMALNGMHVVHVPLMEGEGINWEVEVEGEGEGEGNGERERCGGRREQVLRIWGASREEGFRSAESSELGFQEGFREGEGEGEGEVVWKAAFPAEADLKAIVVTRTNGMWRIVAPKRQCRGA